MLVDAACKVAVDQAAVHFPDIIIVVDGFDGDALHIHIIVDDHAVHITADIGFHLVQLRVVQRVFGNLQFFLYIGIKHENLRFHTQLIQIGIHQLYLLVHADIGLLVDDGLRLPEGDEIYCEQKDQKGEQDNRYQGD